MKIKGKHIGITLLLFLSFIGIWTIGEGLTLLGVISVSSIIILIVTIAISIIKDWDKTFYEHKN